MIYMKTIDENRPQDNVEVIKKCSKCGGEYTMNFTPRTAEDWRAVGEAAASDGMCQRCNYGTMRNTDNAPLSIIDWQKLAQGSIRFYL